MSEPTNRRFEQEWNMAFNDKELTPSDAVWKGVELQIAKSENDSNKKRILFFQLLAAASVSFAMVVGSFQLYDYYNDENIELADSKMIESGSIDNSNLDVDRKNQTDKQSTTTSKDLLIVDTFKESSQFAGNENSVTFNKTSDINNKKTITEESNVDVKQPIPTSTDQSIILSGMSDDYIDKTYLNSLGYDLEYAEPSEIELRMVPWLSFVGKSNKKKTHTNNSLWAGINMSAGTFDPNSSNGIVFASSQAVTGNNVDFNEQNDLGNIEPVTIGSEETGNVYGVGFNLGTQISNRVVLLGGLNYLQQSTSSKSNVVTSGSNNVVVSSSRELNNSAQFETTDEYEIQNTYESISLPVQAGYFVLDRKFNILFLGGIANDFFIERNISDTSGKSLESNADYNSDGYSLYAIGGIVGTQFSYDLGDNYSIALQPQFKQMLNSNTPDGNKPSSFELGFRFSYKLK